MYSRHRLFLISLAWIVAGAAVFAVTGGFGAAAGGGGCENPRCAFPAENYDGGIIMGLTFLRVEGGNPVMNWDPDNQAPLPNSDSTERVSYVGVKYIDNVNDMFIYKAWRYDDPVTQRRENAYLWLDAGTANLAMEGGSDTDCSGNPSGYGLDCALSVNASEISAEVLRGRGCVAWFCLTLSTEDYWVPEPSEDTCGIPSLCLDSGEAEGEWVEMEDAYFRLHGGTTQYYNGADKNMTLQNVYAEIRYGRGTDRAHIFGGSTDGQFSHPADGAALSHAFDCTGNPSAGTPCIIDIDDQNPPPTPIESYEDPY